MAVLCEAISVIVSVETLDRLYPGGAEAYELACPNATFCSDGRLTRVGFMSNVDVEVFVWHLGRAGLLFANDRREFVDIAVVDQVNGLTTSCDWLTSELVDGVRWCWPTGAEFGATATPLGWTPEHSALLELHPDGGERPVVVHRDGVDHIIGEGGTERFAGRPFGDVRRPDDPRGFDS